MTDKMKFSYGGLGAGVETEIVAPKIQNKCPKCNLQMDLGHLFWIFGATISVSTPAPSPPYENFILSVIIFTYTNNLVAYKINHNFLVFE